MVKSLSGLNRVHEAQMISYLKLSNIHVGLVFNFNVKNLTNQETCSSQGYCDMFIEINKPSGV